MWTIEHSAIGRIVIPPRVPAGFAVFCTTADYPGRIIADDISGVLHERFAIDAAVTTCVQIHSANVVHAGREEKWRECDSCDALWTAETHVSLGIKVADCLPIVMLDPQHSVVADIHSGWRGAVQQITANTIDAIERETAFDAASALAYLGPSIRACCFEVGDEVAAQFDARFVDRASYDKPHVDLPAMTASILRARGFAEERIFDSGLCTRCEGSIFHSYRRQGKGGGRNLMIAAQ